MAKEKKKKEGEKQGRIGGLLARFGLQAALIAIIGLAGLSFLAMGIIKQASKPPKELPKVANTVQADIKLPPELAKPNFPPPPQTAPVPAAAAVAATTGQPAQPVQPATTVASATTMTGPDQKGPVSGQMTATLPSGAPTTAPASPPATAAPPTPGAPAPASNAPTTKAPPVPVSSPPPPGTPTPTAATTATPSQATIFPPPAATEASKVDEQGLLKPVWQTVDQNWDKVETEENPPEKMDADGAAWRQIGVGQKDEVESTPTTKVASLPVPKPEPSAPAVKPAPTSQPEKRVAKTRRTYRKSRKSPSAKTASRTQVKLAIINESGRPGHAETYRNVLRAMGYQVNRIETRTRRPGPTTILYSSGKKAKADALARKIPGDRAVAPLGRAAREDLIIVVR